jgi:hypothetical protein
VEAFATKVDTKKVMDLRDYLKMSKEDEAYDEYTWYDGSIESYDKEDETSEVVKDEATYAKEFTNYTYDC